MSKKICLEIDGHRFDVNLEEEFAFYLEQQMTKDFNMDGKNELKVLLQAYVRKNHDFYMQEQEIKEILKKIEN
ncbi:MAG: hypothetical protein Q7S59_08160 [Sulfurimonas sp.]|nr:hypothetical protein [Sulfurimonas sp.]